MSTVESERSQREDRSGGLAEAVRDYRWYVLFVVLEVALGVTAVVLDALGPNATGAQSNYDVVAGMVGGWMVILAITAVILFVIVRVLDLMEDADDHYRDYMES